MAAGRRAVAARVVAEGDAVRLVASARTALSGEGAHPDRGMIAPGVVKHPPAETVALNAGGLAQPAAQYAVAIATANGAANDPKG